MEQSNPLREARFWVGLLHRDRPWRAGAPCVAQRNVPYPLQVAEPGGEHRPRLQRGSCTLRRACSLLGLGAALTLTLALEASAGEPVVLETPKPALARRAWPWKRPRTAAMPASIGSAGVREWARVLFPRFARPPLDGAMTFNGGFGEYRAGHFHAGVDFGTGERTGKPVHAPLSGHVARVRTSGVGYGRSIYVQSRDGRLLQFGHLDAFAEPVAAFLAAV